MLQYSTRLKASKCLTRLNKSLYFTLQSSAAYANHQLLAKKFRNFSETVEETPAPVGRPVNELSIGVLTESEKQEKRVAMSPASAQQLVKKGFKVNVASDAGLKSNFTNQDYLDSGANVVSESEALQSNIVFKVNAPSVEQLESMKPESTLYSMFYPAQSGNLVEVANKNNVTTFAMDSVPRISRAQIFDVLSSQANIKGYKAVIEAANLFGRTFAAQMTAAGKVPPAKVLVIGAGVAGLAAIQAAKGLGAIVRAFDTRPAAGEQILSMGAEFLTVDIKEDGTGTGGYGKEMSKEFIEAEMALFAKQAKDVDIVITTA